MLTTVIIAPFVLKKYKWRRLLYKIFSIWYLSE